MVDIYAPGTNEILVANAVYLGLVFALHFGLDAHFRANPPSTDYKDWKEQKRITFLQALNAVVTSFFVTAFYAWGFYSLDGSMESRWPNSLAFTPLPQRS